MSDLEQRTAALLRSKSHEVESPTRIPHPIRRRIRRRQALAVGVVAATAVALVAGSVAAVNVVPDLFRGNTVTPAQVSEGPTAESVFVLDLQGGEGNANVDVFALESGRKQLVRQFQVFGGQAMTPSPDGRKVYISSVANPDGDGGSVSIFDTENGERTDVVPAPPPVSIPRPSYPLLTVSTDGEWLYLLAFDPATEAKSIATIDTTARVTLPRSVIVEGCDPIGAMPSAKHARSVYVICEDSQEIVFVEVGDEGDAADVRRMPLPRQEDVQEDEFGNQRVLGTLAYATLSPSEEFVYAVTLSGRVFVLDTTSGRVVDETKLRLPGKDSYVALGQVRQSADGQLLYLGLADLTSGNVSVSDRIMKVSTSDLQPRGIIPTAGGMNSFEVGPRPGRVVGVSPESRSVLVLDAVRDRQEAQFTDVGHAPSFVQIPLLGKG